MTQFLINMKDVFFILKDQLQYGELCRLERYRDLNEKTLDLLVNEALRFAQGVVAPLNELCESDPPRFENGRVICPPAMRDAFRRCGEDGWTAVARDPEFGGQGMPHMMRIVVNDFLYGACQSFNMAPSLTHGAAHLIESFGAKELSRRFVPNMFSGRWAGTMALTEPDAGSNLAALATSARPAGGGFRIKGNKIFISWGEHDLAENIVHLVLARIEGAPEGVKGISLFAAPKFRVNSDGSLGRDNDVACTRIEEKLGLHGSPTAALSFGQRDECVGFLVGRENQGLAHMFQMMNAARINTGVSGMTLASAAYQNALYYARTRVQGRDVAGRKAGSVPILDHPDVRRMLLWMKATVDGMRSMIYTGAMWADLSLTLPPGPEREHFRDLTDFMTPIIKAYCSDMGFRVCETAIQVLGGYGFCRDYPLEQYLRDAKIMSLYEGTNGIQSMDLMGRKMTLRDGACLAAFREEVMGFCEARRDDPAVGSGVRLLESVARGLWETAAEMAGRQASDPLQWASYTYPALLAFSEVAMAWRLLDMAAIAAGKAGTGKQADFFRAKVLQAAWWVETTLPHTRVRAGLCTRAGRETMDMPDGGF